MSALCYQNAMGQKKQSAGELGGGGGKGNLKDRILEAYVLESLQPVPCQENIGQVGCCNLMQPQMVYASLFWSLLPTDWQETKDTVLCGVVILPPSVGGENT